MISTLIEGTIFWKCQRYRHCLLDIVIGIIVLYQRFSINSTKLYTHDAPIRTCTFIGIYTGPKCGIILIFQIAAVINLTGCFHIGICFQLRLYHSIFVSGSKGTVNTSRVLCFRNFICLFISRKLIRCLCIRERLCILLCIKDICRIVSLSCVFCKLHCL